ncbi:MAG: cell division protein FtsQ/DivIB [Alphaproteobacteria bacterium]|nr:cell division protein FtsQ/DivIB [Alphaproteobacteria bacterium]
MSTAALEAGRAGSRAAPRGRRAAPPPTKLQALSGLRVSTRAAATLALLAASLVAVAGLATGGRGGLALAAGQQAGKTLAAAVGEVGPLLQGRLPDLGWRVAHIRLVGATPAAEAEIRAASGVSPGAPLSQIDLAAVRARVEGVGWVAHARVVRLAPDTLEIQVAQRPLMAVWQHAGREVVVAANGAPVPQVDPTQFGALPLIVGEDANSAAPVLLGELAQRPALASRLAAAVRVDDRRWTLDLKDGTQVLLPADDEGHAMDRLTALDAHSGVLSLGLARIDLRDPDMILVRPRAAAPTATSKAKGGA